MSPFRAEGKQVVCLGCGARIGNTTADKIEHLTTPSRARALTAQRLRTTQPPTEGDPQ